MEEITVFNICKQNLQETELSQMQNSDVLIFAFPLYVDSIPSHLLRFLVELQNRGLESKNKKVYCIINNGFFEGRQNHVAATIMKNWCRISGIVYGQSIGVGAGEMLPFLRDIPLGHGPNRNIGMAFRKLADNILSLKSEEDLFVLPNWPRFLWRIQASLLVWYPRARKNGVRL